MDQRQQCDLYGYIYTGSGTHGYICGDSFHENRPYYPPERCEAYEDKPVVFRLANTHHESHTGRSFIGGEVPDFQPGLTVSPFHNQFVATSPGTFHKDYAYSGDALSQGISNRCGPAGWAHQERNHCRSQECVISEPIQARSEPTSHPGQRYPDLISPYGSSTDWGSNITPIEQVSASFIDAPKLPYPGSSTTCAIFRNHSHTDGVSGYHPDQKHVNATTDWSILGANKKSLRPTGEYAQSNRQLPAQDTRHIATHHDRHGVPYLEQPKSRYSPRKSAAANAPNTPVIIQADEDGADDGLTKKRKRKPRTIKPRKARTLTDEGKAHAKAVRECPGGACADCKRKKSKARDPPVTNLVFYTLITVPSALTGYQRTWPWSRLTDGLRTLHGLSHGHRIKTLGITILCSIDHLRSRILATTKSTHTVCEG